MCVRTRALTAAIVLCQVALAGCGGSVCEPEDYQHCPGTEWPPRNGDRVTIEQGIWGDVWFWEGDFMPPCPTGSVTAVARELRIHALTGIDEVEPAGYSAFYTAVHTELVAATWSDTTGFFEVELEPGWYSVFAVEDTFCYASLFGGGGLIWPVHVVEGEVAEILFDINYLAYW
jgi:hypothetical protein